VVRALERAGFVTRSQRGSHRKLREVAPGTLRSILSRPV
jgi:predicted RNA binding protein YcfA (HicA-like mRNA interferase family)